MKIKPPPRHKLCIKFWPKIMCNCLLDFVINTFIIPLKRTNLNIICTDTTLNIFVDNIAMVQLLKYVHGNPTDNLYL